VITNLSSFLPVVTGSTPQAAVSAEAARLTPGEMNTVLGASGERGDALDPTSNLTVEQLAYLRICCKYVLALATRR